MVKSIILEGVGRDGYGMFWGVAEAQSAGGCGRINTLD